MTTRTSSVEVAIRARPLRPELNEVTVGWEVHRKSLLELNSENETTFTFDRVYDMNSTTEEIYATSVRDSIVRNVVQGYNGTVFAYGQTGSGKSHTMLGDQRGMGITAMALNDLYDGLQKERQAGKTVKVYLEMLEIYNEQLRDLMARKDTAPATLSIRENEHGVYVHNALRQEVSSAPHCLECMDAEAKNRVVASTKMNEQSSRSHCLIRVIVEKTELFDADSDDSDGEGPAMITGRKLQKKVVSSLNLVDLAGSERVSKTGATGLRMVEGGHINKSLACLTTVINRLSEPVKKGQSTYIPFRDSKLTHLLKTALGGNSFTTVFCCITPAGQHVDESRSTLQFAQRAKAIKNEITLNEVMDSKTKIRELELKVKQLKRLLVASDIYLMAKSLLLRKAHEDAQGGAGGASAAAAGEHVERLESLVEQLTRENENLRDEAQQAAQYLEATGGAAALAAAGGHVDPAMAGMGFADSEEVATLKVELQEARQQLEEVTQERDGLAETVAEYDTICDGMTKEAEEREQQVASLKAQVRKQESENQVLQNELNTKLQLLDQAQEQRRQLDQNMMDRSRGDQLMESLTKLQIEHQQLEVEHTTLIEMFSREEIEREAAAREAEEQRSDLERRVTELRGEAQDANNILWRLMALGHLAAQGHPLDKDDLKLSQTVKPARAEHALKALELFVASRANRPPPMGEHGAGGGGASIGGAAADGATPVQGTSSARVGGGSSTGAAAPAGVASSGASPTSASSLAAPSALAAAIHATTPGPAACDMSTAREEQLQARIKELEATLQRDESRRDIIIDTKLKRMQELVLRLHTTNGKLLEDVHKLAQENNTLHDIIRKESKAAKAAKREGLEPANEQLLRNRALFTAVPAPQHYHN